MSIDLSKLSPAPWAAQWQMNGDCNGHSLRSESPAGLIGKLYNMADLEFAALARNAFGVMLRRGWSAVKSSVEGEGWQVMMFGAYFAFAEDGEAGFRGDGRDDIQPAHWPDPFTALVEADEWYRQNVEAKPQ